MTTWYEKIEQEAAKSSKFNDVLVMVGYEEISLRSEFGLWLNTGSPKIGKPEAETAPVYVPGSDMVLDLSRALDGKLHFKKRTITMSFFVLRPKSRWEEIRSDLADTLQGKRLTFSFKNDLPWIWEGIFDVEFEPGEHKATVTMNVICDPYKYYITTATDIDWKWDTFNFETGVINDKDRKVGKL